MSQIPIVHKSVIQKAYVRLKVLAPTIRGVAEKSRWTGWLKFAGLFFLFCGIFNLASPGSYKVGGEMVIGGLYAFIAGWKMQRDYDRLWSELHNEEREIRNRMEEIKVFPGLYASEWYYEDRWNDFDPLSDDSYR